VITFLITFTYISSENVELWFLIRKSQTIAIQGKQTASCAFS